MTDESANSSTTQSNTKAKSIIQWMIIVILIGATIGYIAKTWYNFVAARGERIDAEDNAHKAAQELERAKHNH